MPREPIPQPFKPENGTDLEKKKKTAMEALRSLPRAAAAIVALNFLQGCFVPMSELNMAQSASEANKTPKEMLALREECRLKMFESQELAGSRNPQIAQLGQSAAQKFNVCFIQADQPRQVGQNSEQFFNEKMYSEAQEALDQALKLQKKIREGK